MATNNFGAVGGWVLSGILSIILLGQCVAKSGDSGTVDDAAAAGLRTMYVQPSGLNCRTTASGSAKLVERINRGERVVVAEETNGWSKLSRPIGCWVASSYLGETEPVEEAQPLGFSSAAAEEDDVAPEPRSSRRSRYFANCSDARAQGAAPVRRGDPGYSRKLDRDGDGVGCE